MEKKYKQKDIIVKNYLSLFSLSIFTPDSEQGNNNSYYNQMIMLASTEWLRHLAADRLVPSSRTALGELMYALVILDKVD